MKSYVKSHFHLIGPSTDRKKKFNDHKIFTTLSDDGYGKMVNQIYPELEVPKIKATDSM